MLFTRFVVVVSLSYVTRLLAGIDTCLVWLVRPCCDIFCVGRYVRFLCRSESRIQCILVIGIYKEAFGGALVDLRVGGLVIGVRHPFLCRTNEDLSGSANRLFSAIRRGRGRLRIGLI